MLGALSRAEVFVPRSGEKRREAFSAYVLRSARACSAARDTISITKVNATDRSEESGAEDPLRVPGSVFTMIAGGNDTIAGLLVGALDALSIRRDQRLVPLDNPAVVPDRGA